MESKSLEVINMSSEVGEFWVETVQAGPSPSLLTFVPSLQLFNLLSCFFLTSMSLSTSSVVGIHQHTERPADLVVACDPWGYVAAEAMVEAPVLMIPLEGPYEGGRGISPSRGV